jgi:hypothetical protein
MKLGDKVGEAKGLFNDKDKYYYRRISVTR